MIKKLCKNIIVITLLIYAVISLCFNVYSYLQNEKFFEELAKKTDNTKEYSQIVFSVKKEMDNYDFVMEKHFLGRLYIINYNLDIAVVSLILGIFISLILSIDDSKIIKYILIFIIGNICFNLPFVLFYRNILFFKTFEEIYFMVFKEFFVLYMILFALCLSIKIFIAKYRIEKMNRFLNKK